MTAIVSRVRVLLAHQGMSLPDALAPADVRLPVWVKSGKAPKADIVDAFCHFRFVP
ncbi:MAG: hypothetical protein WCF72_04735 [Pseudolabrys sp.]